MFAHYIGPNYYSFNYGGIHFIGLDDVDFEDTWYYGRIDSLQMSWLKQDLAANKKPVCVTSHIPLVSICAFFFMYGKGETKKPAEFWRIGDNFMHRDVKPLVKLLGDNNVKLCISGHIHLLDQIQYMGVNFVCDGAVSGNWWGGPHQEVAEGYGVFDLYDDGTFDHQYVTYGWEARNG